MKWHELVDENQDLSKVKWSVIEIRCDYCGQEIIFGYNRGVFEKEVGGRIREFQKSNLSDQSQPFSECPNCLGKWKENEYEGKWFGYTIIGILNTERFKSEGSIVL